MIRAAFCDDEINTLGETQVFFAQYRRERNREIVYTAFHSPIELMAEIERGTLFDVLFRNILTPGENGLETTAEIRAYDHNVKIIFLIASAEPAVQSCTVEAYFYQLKPPRREGFSRVMGSVLERCGQERESGLILQCRSGITCLDPGRLEFCVVIHRTPLFHRSSGRATESTGRLDGLSRRPAPCGCFLRPHRSCLIRLGYVRNISRRAVTMSGLTEIPAPRGKYNGIKDAFLAYAFLNGQVQL